MSTKLSELTFAVAKDCSLCGANFVYEKLLSRKVSPKSIDISLRNSYAPSLEAKDPLIYSIVVCPGCLYAAYEPEFDSTKIDGRDFRKAKKAAEDICRVFKLTGEHFKSLRDFRTGLASYYLAEIWYAMREDFGFRNLRIALSLYRRTWLLETARKGGIVTEDFYARDRAYAFQTAETYFERSFLEDRPPDRFYYGPDYGCDFGPAMIPYLVSYINFLLAGDPDAAPFAMRSARFSKSKKFLDCAKMVALKEGPEDLRRKIEILKEGLALLKTKLQEEERASEPPAPNDGMPVETMEWELPLEQLYAQYGETKRADEVVMREGERSRDMFFVLDGRVNVLKSYRTSGGSDQRLIAVLSAGSFFGEMSLLDSAPRFATVVAAEPTRLIRVNADDLQAIIRAYPPVALRIMSVLTTRLRNYDDFVQNRLLSLLSTERLQAIDSTGRRSDSKGTLSAELSGLMSEVGDD